MTVNTKRNTNRPLIKTVNGMFKKLKNELVIPPNTQPPVAVNEDIQNINATFAPPEVEMTEPHFLQEIASFSLANSLCLIIDEKLSDLVQ